MWPGSCQGWQQHWQGSLQLLVPPPQAPLPQHLLLSVLSPRLGLLLPLVVLLLEPRCWRCCQQRVQSGCPQLLPRPQQVPQQRGLSGWQCRHLRHWQGQLPQLQRRQPLL